MFHIIIAELFRKQLSLMLLLGKRLSFSAQENANHSDCFSVSDHSLGILSILSISNNSITWNFTWDSGWEAESKACCINAHISWSCIWKMYTGKNQSQVKNQTWGITCKWQESERAHLELEKQYRANIHLNSSWFESKSRVTSDLDRPGLSGGLRPVLKKKKSVTKLCAD